MQAWLSSSLVRHYPASRAKRRQTLTLHAARGESLSFQAAFRTEGSPAKVSASATCRDGFLLRVRRVGYVPVLHFSTATPAPELEGIGHLPGLAPDPLFPEAEAHAGSYETNAFWVNVDVPSHAPPGRYPVTVALSPEGGEAVALIAVVVVHRGTVHPRRDFPVTQWFYADALCDWYRTELWEESFWPILDAYVEDIAAHGQDTILVPVFTPPTDGVKKPTQLLGVRRDGGRYVFDWTLVERWVDCAREHGVSHFEWNHLFTQWGAARAIRIYEGHGEEGALLWPAETANTSATYREFLSQYLPELHRFLAERDLLDVSFFHVSDEPHGEEARANYRGCREMLRELAPWMRVMDALSEIEFAREKLVDVPIPSISVAPQFAEGGFPAWAYFCCGPRGAYLNRLLDTPLSKISMAGWLFYRNRARGFLHWGYNYWYKSQTTELIDPYRINDALNWPGWPPGDPFIVYPGDSGPVDSIRWEVFAESLRDYALLQSAGVEPEDPMLSEIRDYADFPKDEPWIRTRRRELLKRLDR
ncbi:MAG: DUF4091 domain-containing protein [Armatimonadota bacterium]|nr:MAG: DUF4091 domain-containing protein [Armatimonadota bacterium]